MKKVLIVAYYFPPISTIGTMRPLAFSRHLPAFGWIPRVVAADPHSVDPPLPVDDELTAGIPAETHVDRVRYWNPLAAMIRCRDGFRRRLGAAPASLERAPDAPGRPFLGGLKEAVLEHIFETPDAQRWWRGGAVRAGLRGERPDVVYATGGPWTALLVGRSLARRFRVPFIADFRDPWSRNPFRTYSPSAWRRCRHLERAVCRAAAQVVVNTPELCQQFVSDYPEFGEKFVTISNGFDTTEPGQTVHLQVPTRDGRRPRLELWHFGTVYGKRSPTALLTAVAGLVARGTLDASILRLRFVGPWETDDDDPSSRLARQLETAGVITRESPVPRRTCLALMRQAQILLAIQPDSPLQVPGKLYEYIATRRPLIVIGGEGATANLVTRHALGRCCVNEVEPIRQLLVELMTGDGPALPPADAVERFNYQRLAGRLSDVFLASLDGRPVALPAAAF